MISWKEGFFCDTGGSDEKTQLPSSSRLVVRSDSYGGGRSSSIRGATAQQQTPAASAPSTIRGYSVADDNRRRWRQSDNTTRTTGAQKLPVA